MKFIHILLFYFTSICFLSSLEGQKKSLYSSIFEIDGLINVNINTNLGHLVRKSSKEEYQQAEITNGEPANVKSEMQNPELNKCKHPTNPASTPNIQSSQSQIPNPTS